MNFRASAITGCSVLLLLCASASAQTTSGPCSPIIIGSNNAVTCTTDNSVVKALLADMNAKLKTEKAAAAMLARQYAAILNQIAMLNEKVLTNSREIDQMRELLQQGAGRTATSVADTLAQLARETLARNVQKIDALRVTITRLEGSYGHISIYFEVVNEGVTNMKAMFYGAGSRYGYGGSSITVRGERVAASSITLGGQSAKEFMSTTFLPGIALNGRIDFDGVSASESDISVFELAYGRSHLKPDGDAVFRIKE